MSTASQPLVSICISAYNVERYLGETLRSVLDQTYKRIEVILLDNGSVDGTYDVARSFSDERLRVLRIESNIGGYQGMNKVIEMAQGQLIAVYHSDDVYEPEIVAKEVAYLQAYPNVGAVFCMDHLIDDEGKIYGKNSLPPFLQNQEWLEYDDLFPDMLRNHNSRLCCPTFMTRRQTLDRVGLFNPEKYDIGADTEMWLRILRQFPLGILNELLVRYRHRKDNWSRRFNNLRTEPDPFFAIMDEYLEMDGWHSKLNADDLVEYNYLRCDDDTVRAANLLIQGDPDRALKLLQQPYPWRTLLINFRRRKARVLLLRWLIRCGVALRAIRPLARTLVWTEYGGHN